MSPQFWICFAVVSLLSLLVVMLIFECRLLKRMAEMNRDRMNYYLTRLRMAQEKLKFEE